MSVNKELDDRITEGIADKAGNAIGIKQLTRMVGLQSVKATTDYEADALDQEAKDVRDAVWGDGKVEESSDEESEDDVPMRDILATGPVTIHQGNTETHTESEKTAPPPRPERQPNKWAAAGLAALGLGAAISLPILAWNLTRPTTEPTPDGYRLEAYD